MTWGLGNCVEPWFQWSLMVADWLYCLPREILFGIRKWLGRRPIAKWSEYRKFHDGIAQYSHEVMSEYQFDVMYNQGTSQQEACPLTEGGNH